MNTTGNNRIYPKVEIKQKMLFGIYALICPIYKVPIYVGCSSNLTRRYYAHLVAGERNKLCTYIHRVLYKNEKRKFVTMKVLFWTDSVDTAREKELELIEVYNKNDGLLNTQLHNGYAIKKKRLKELLSN